MKKLLFTVAAFSFATFSFAQKKADDVAKFKTEVIDMGKLQQGSPTTAIFTVANIGKEPLIIEQANPTCGCTIGDYTRSPIAPGQNGEIKATYNAAGVGHFEKRLTVKFAGADDMKSITIKGDVLTKEEYAKLNGSNSGAASETNTVTPKLQQATPAATPVKKATSTDKHSMKKGVKKTSTASVAQ